MKFHIDASFSAGIEDKKSKETGQKASAKLLEQKYQYMLRILEQEKERRKSVEHKASLFLTSNAIIGSLLVWSSRILFETSSIQSFVIALVLLVLVILLARTVIYTLKVLKKSRYYVLDENDAKSYDTEEEFYEQMTKKVEAVITNNHEVINRKVDYMALAQNSYRWFWIAMVVYLLIVFGFQLFAMGNEFSLTNSIFSVNVLLFAIVFLVGLSLGNINKD